jgi:hypothetical protein
MNALPEPDRTKLVKLLGLLSSDHPGEQVAAATAATRFMHARGLTWQELLEPQRRGPAPATWREAVARLLQHPRDLTAWENRFLSDISRLPSISPKQRLFLSEIAARVLGGGL